MIDLIINYLKANNIDLQVDLGNLSVGISTFFVAIISLYVALKSTRGNANQRIAEFRQIWIDNLRNDVASIIKTTFYTLNTALDENIKRNEKDEKLSNGNSDLQKLESLIALRINQKEKEHDILIELVKQLRGRVAVFCVSPINAAAENKNIAVEIQELGIHIVFVTNFIIRKEWKRTINEVKGRSLINVYIRSIAGAIRSKTSTNRIKEAEDFLYQLGRKPV